jgi:signal transduction histidine kinase
LENNKIVVTITDNGIGIAPASLNKIFNFGFTTKKSGHGFGLHASALAINQLGGDLSVNSNGLNQGATFVIHLPYRRPSLL